MKKRNRACEECQRLKIKCDVSASLAGACERCSRSNLDCVPAAPRLQRDRINELENQIQELRHALEYQRGSSTSSHGSPGSLSEEYDHAVLSFLDARIPMSKQKDLFSLFAHHGGAAWPVIRLPMDLDQIREKSPILLLSILVYSYSQNIQGTEIHVHNELVQETMHLLGNEVIGRGQRSLELVQALLVSAFWNKPTRRGQASCYQIVQLAADMAIDLGIAGPPLLPSPVAFFSRNEDATSLEACRTWLACFVALSTSSISTRRPIAVPWNSHHQECLLLLENRGELSDILLCQIVRITQLIEEISSNLCLCQLDIFVDGNDYSTQATIESLKNKVDAWAAQVPPSLASSQTLKVWHHVAMIYVYELVLHTPTNKASFAAPFIPGRIVVNDFPKPTDIIPPLQTALVAIVQNCHGLIDTVTEMDPALILSLPSFCFTPTILYALFVLVNGLVASTDPANTYGQVIPKDAFHIEQCSLKLRALATCVKSLDPTLSCYSTMLLDATGWLEEWHNDYDAILRRFETLAF
jgi:hypothetical protein